MDGILYKLCCTGATQLYRQDKKVTTGVYIDGLLCNRQYISLGLGAIWRYCGVLGTVIPNRAAFNDTSRHAKMMRSPYAKVLVTRSVRNPLNQRHVEYFFCPFLHRQWIKPHREFSQVEIGMIIAVLVFSPNLY